MPPRRKLSAVAAEAPKPAPRDLRESIADAVAAMDWLTPSDLALVDLALAAATQLEQAQERADELAALYGEARGQTDVYARLKKLEAMCDVAKFVGWLGPQIQGYLKDLGGAPAARKALRPDAPIGGRLGSIRARAGAAGGAAGVDTPEGLDPA